MARAMNITGRLATVLAAGALGAGLLAACSSSSGGSSGSSNSSPSPAAFNETAAKATITSNWQTFFDARKPTAAKAALLQDAANLQPVIDAQAKNPQAKGTSVKVKSVVIDPTHQKATVTYDLAVNGQVQLPNATGVAVYENGTWKVSKASFCGLIALGAQATGTKPPPQCASS